MSRTRVPGDGPQCWCGVPATFSGYCNAHYNRDTGEKTNSPVTPPVCIGCGKPRTSPDFWPRCSLCVESGTGSEGVMDGASGTQAAESRAWELGYQSGYDDREKMYQEDERGRGLGRRNRSRAADGEAVRSLRAVYVVDSTKGGFITWRTRAAARHYLKKSGELCRMRKFIPAISAPERCSVSADRELRKRINDILFEVSTLKRERDEYRLPIGTLTGKMLVGMFISEGCNIPIWDIAGPLQKRTYDNVAKAIVELFRKEAKTEIILGGVDPKEDWSLYALRTVYGVAAPWAFRADLQHKIRYIRERLGDRPNSMVPQALQIMEYIEMVLGINHGPYLEGQDIGVAPDSKSPGETTPPPVATRKYAEIQTGIRIGSVWVLKALPSKRYKVTDVDSNLIHCVCRGKESSWSLADFNTLLKPWIQAKQRPKTKKKAKKK